MSQDNDCVNFQEISVTKSVFTFFWSLCAACGVSVPQLGMEPGPSAVKAPSLNHWTAREFPVTNSINTKVYYLFCGYKLSNNSSKSNFSSLKLFQTSFCKYLRGIFLLFIIIIYHILTSVPLSYNNKTQIHAYYDSCEKTGSLSN